MKRILSIIFILSFLAVECFAGVQSRIAQTVGARGKGATDYCASQAWNTYTDFALDFDHTSDEKSACEDATTSETGTYNAGTDTTTLTPDSPISGGKCLNGDADSQYIQFDNTDSYFASASGEIRFSVQLSDNNTGNDRILDIFHLAAQDLLNVYVMATGVVQVNWEDNNDGGFTIASVDLDSYYDKWVQIWIQWDTTRCTDGTCDGVGEDEVQVAWRADANGDGDFGDGGVENWSAWAGETSATDANTWAGEPGDNDINFGIKSASATYTVPIYLDDLEIKKTQPTWGSE
jgi:hypothetical protein